MTNSEILKTVVSPDHALLYPEFLRAMDAAREDEREKAWKVVRALEYLMAGVAGLPPLTAIEGVLKPHYRRAERVIDNYKNEKK